MLPFPFRVGKWHLFQSTLSRTPSGCRYLRVPTSTWPWNGCGSESGFNMSFCKHHHLLVANSCLVVFPTYSPKFPSPFVGYLAPPKPIETSANPAFWNFWNLENSWVQNTLISSAHRPTWGPCKHRFIECQKRMPTEVGTLKIAFCRSTISMSKPTSSSWQTISNCQAGRSPAYQRVWRASCWTEVRLDSPNNST